MFQEAAYVNLSYINSKKNLESFFKFLSIPTHQDLLTIQKYLQTWYLNQVENYNCHNLVEELFLKIVINVDVYKFHAQKVMLNQNRMNLDPIKFKDQSISVFQLHYTKQVILINKLSKYKKKSLLINQVKYDSIYILNSLNNLQVGKL
ncbi:unnamed protein product [Paramecium octaurelia]|uniref:Uncharacterized protein n=1 Tax=Paramecium octaurelia TaxID=43137 RepID=A0A8S1YK62_PAROT|nr:unnamed protein product [Paramecium octaurelia]